MPPFVGRGYPCRRLGCCPIITTLSEEGLGLPVESGRSGLGLAHLVVVVFVLEAWSEVRFVSKESAGLGLVRLDFFRFMGSTRLGLDCVEFFRFLESTGFLGLDCLGAG